LYAIYQMVPFPMTLNDSNLIFKVTPFLKLNITQTATDTAKVTIEGE